MEHQNLFYTETEELDYTRFLMLRPGADRPSTSTEMQFVDNEDSSSNSELIFGTGRPQKRRKILTTLEPQSKINAQASSITTSSGKERKDEPIDLNKENKSCNCLAKLSAENKETRRILVRLTEEIVLLKKEIKTMRENSAKTNIEEILPKFPFNDPDEFSKMEKKVEDNEYCFVLLKEEFLNSGHRSNPDLFVRGSLKRIFTDKLATQFTWLGTKHKKNLRSMSVILALKSAFKERFNGSDDILERVVKKHFHYAADRISKKEARQKKIRRSSSSTLMP